MIEDKKWSTWIHCLSQNPYWFHKTIFPLNAQHIVLIIYLDAFNLH